MQGKETNIVWWRGNRKDDRLMRAGVHWRDNRNIKLVYKRLPGAAMRKPTGLLEYS